MAEKIIEKIEDIYPLTIVSMRFNKNFVIFKCECDSDFVFNAQMDEIHDCGKWLESNVPTHYYGFGETIEKALEDYKSRQTHQNEF